MTKLEIERVCSERKRKNKVEVELKIISRRIKTEQHITEDK